MVNTNITDSLLSGSRARLIPVVADSKKEERATSVLLSTFMLAPQFAESVLAEAGARVGTRTTIKCYTEIVFKNKDQNKIRPDGLIVLTRGTKSWSALIESKVGGNELKNEQIEAYLDLTREVRADALITISNQFATIPTHHPPRRQTTQGRRALLSDTISNWLQGEGQWARRLIRFFVCLRQSCWSRQLCTLAPSSMWVHPRLASS